jgi:hypothetical protein
MIEIYKIDSSGRIYVMKVMEFLVMKHVFNRLMSKL